MFASLRNAIPLAWLVFATVADADQRNSALQFFNLSLEELSQIEITTATGNGTPIVRAPAIASVISAAEIEAMGARNLFDVLETVPGIHISLSSLNRLDSIVSVRGIHTEFNPHVLILINGVPLSFGAQGGRPLLFRLPVTSINQIEVIRGPGSAVYGADAYAGVINVITKDLDAISGTEVGARVGSFSSEDFWLQSGKKLGDWELVFGLSYQSTDGDDERIIEADLQTAIDAEIGTDVSLAPHSLATDYEVFDAHLALQNQHWEANLWTWMSDSGVGAGGAQALDNEGRDEGDLYMVDVNYRSADTIENWDLRAQVAYQYYENAVEFVLFPPGAVLPIAADGNVSFGMPANAVAFPDGLLGNPEGRVEDSLLNLVAIYDGWQDHRVRLAVGSKHQSIETRESKNFGPGVIDGSEGVVDGTLTNVSNTPFVYLEDSSRTIHFITLQDQWNFAKDWELTAGLRYDDYSDFGSTVNPRVALVWQTNDRLTSKALYGSAFRAPSFSEQFFQNNPVSLGNPDLDPETIDTLELSFDYRATERLALKLNLFNYNARDMIEYVPDPNTLSSVAANARDQDGYGFEMEFKWRTSNKFQLSGNYSWQRAEDLRNNSDIADAPEQKATLMSNWEMANRWFIHGQLHWVADRERAFGDPREAVDDYTLVNLTLRHTDLLPNVDVALAVRNALDEEAREPSDGTISDDFPLESRSIWAEISYTFN